MVVSVAEQIHQGYSQPSSILPTETKCKLIINHHHHRYHHHHHDNAMNILDNHHHPYHRQNYI